MRSAPIIDRLKAAGLKRVYGALELAGLKNRPERLPAYFVMPESWSASPNKTSGILDQKLAERFGVVIMLDGASRREDQIAEDLHIEEGRVIDALAAWTHPDASAECELLGGGLVSVSGNILSWMVSFSTGRHVRKAAS